MTRHLDPALVRRVQQLLNRARVMAEAPAAQLGGTIRRTHPGWRPPVSRGLSTLDQIALRLRGARTDSDLREVIEFAEVEIRSMTHGPDREPESREQFRYRVITEYESKPARIAADRERVSIALIRQIRQAAGRDPRTGRTLSDT